ncbi:hypothetical protein KJZ61_01040 [Candidatus Dependentiae bacterium]|nr:hypothetical protein [Candidatus Dependentiae bacterium]
MLTQIRCQYSTIIDWLLVGASALMYAIGLTMLSFWWWLIALCLVPLFYCALQRKLNWYHGYAWGFVGTLLAGHAEWQGALEKLTTDSSTSLLLTLVFFFYLSIPASLLFLAAHRTASCALIRQHKQHQLIGIIIWATALWLFFVWLTQYSFCVVACQGGAALLHPLIPLATYSTLVCPVALVGIHAALYCFIVWQGLITLVIVTPRIWYVMCLSLVSIGWMILALHFASSTSSERLPSSLPRIGYLSCTFPHDIVISRTVVAFQQYLDAITAHDTAIDIFIAPEDCMSTTHLPHHKHLCNACMPHHVASRHAHILLGAYRHDEKSIYNTLYYFKDGNCVHHFDKRHLMPFTEYTPSVFAMFLSLSKHRAHVLAHGIHKRPQLVIDDTLTLVPYICSELFLLYHPDDEYSEAPILALCSDKWTTYPQVPMRMLLLAKLKALAWHRVIMLISYHIGAWITQKGKVYPLKNCSEILHHASHNNVSIDAIAYQDREEMVEHIGFVDHKKTVWLPLPTLDQHTGLSARYTSAPALDDAALFIILQQCTTTPQGIQIACYSALHDMDEMKFLGTMMLTPTTSQVKVTLHPCGVCSIKDAASTQRIMASFAR